MQSATDSAALLKVLWLQWMRKPYAEFQIGFQLLLRAGLGSWSILKHDHRHGQIPAVGQA